MDAVLSQTEVSPFLYSFPELSVAGLADPPVGPDFQAFGGMTAADEASGTDLVEEARWGAGGRSGRLFSALQALPAGQGTCGRAG